MAKNIKQYVPFFGLIIIALALIFIVDAINIFINPASVSKEEYLFVMLQFFSSVVFMAAGLYFLLYVRVK